MNSSEAVDRLKGILNRPEDDDLFSDPNDYYEALERAQQFYRRQIVSHYPGLLVETSSAISSDDGGESYDLPDQHLGEMEVWTPPGPPNGNVIPPVVPEAHAFGYYVEDTGETGPTLYLTHERSYDPGIYLRWIPASAPTVDADTDPVLPAYMDDMLVFRAAYEMASRPGFLGDPNYYKTRAAHEWGGDPEVPSDAGVLGTLSRQSAHHGLETHGDAGRPWYKRIPE